MADQGTAYTRSLSRWLLYCFGICLELLGIAFMGAVIVMFFGQVEAGTLLSMSARGMVLFYGGWFCVRQGSIRSIPLAQKGDEKDACRT